MKKFKCELCNYSCVKLSTLKKHINSNHTEQQCKVCSKEFKTLMELFFHVAKEHQLEEETWTSTPNSEKEGIKSNFNFSK